MLGLKEQLELIREELLSPSHKLSNILRRAYIFARELNEEDLLEWTEHELEGYEKGSEKAYSVPEYRCISGIIYGRDQADREHSIVLPPKIDSIVTTQNITMPVSEIEAVLESVPDKNITIGLNEETLKLLRKEIPQATLIYIKHPRSTFYRILDQIRTRLLKFSQDVLEEREILRNGTLIEEDVELVKEKFHNSVIPSVTINIETVVFEWSELKDIILNNLKEKGVEASKSDELISELDTAKGQMVKSGEKKIPSGLKGFLKRNKDWIPSTATQLIKLFFE